MLKIKSIKIENIRGIFNKEFELNVTPNRPILFVAPNGFGKSSIAIAFDSLTKHKISLNKNYYYKNDENNSPKISLTIINDNDQEITLTADENSNSISKEFDVFVINNKLVAKTKRLKIKDKTIASSHLTIEPIILIKNIPPKRNFQYSIAEQKRRFGVNGKILPNISSILRNKLFIIRIYEEVDLRKLMKVRTKTKIRQIIEDINELDGTTKEIKRKIDDSFIQRFEEISTLRKIAEIISNEYPLISERYLAAIQISNIYEENPDLFKEVYAYYKYELQKEDYIKLLAPFSYLWQEIKPREKENKLILEFPEANRLSNGERDIIVFLTLLQQAKYKLQKEKCILIIDEIFDYLDDANLVSAQYYITQFIKEFKNRDKKLFPIIMTHLNPLYFKNYVFKKPIICFLERRATNVNEHFKKILLKRDDPLIKEYLDKYFLHFHPDSNEINIREKFRNLRLKETWGNFEIFKKFIDSEFNKYISERNSYCPLAVCTAVRIKIEENIFKLINNQEHQKEFLNQNGTRNKLDYASNIGIDVPELYYLLGIIYNDGLHISDGKEGKISSISSKLENITIRNMIKQIDKVIS